MARSGAGGRSGTAVRRAFRVQRASPARIARARRDRARVSRLRHSHSYGIVLAFVLACFAVAAVAPDGRWATSALVVLLCATLVSALWTSGVMPIRSRSGGGLLAFAVAAAVANLLLRGSVASASVMLGAGALTIAIAAAIGRGVVDQESVNRQSVRGAIAVYILLGLLFAFLYGALASLGHGALFAQGTDGTRALRVYFSYVTLTTVGYGDYSTATSVGHLIALVEALVGQLYLVTVVAVLVSRLRPQEPPITPPG